MKKLIKFCLQRKNLNKNKSFQKKTKKIILDVIKLQLKCKWKKYVIMFKYLIRCGGTLAEN